MRSLAVQGIAEASGQDLEFFGAAGYDDISWTVQDDLLHCRIVGLCFDLHGYTRQDPVHEPRSRL